MRVPPVSTRLGGKKLVVFDLDGTLTKTKSPITRSMSRLLVKLLEKNPIAIIGGGKYAQFKKQFLQHFSCPRALLPRLFLFPTTATSFYRYCSGWKAVYRHELPPATRRKVIRTFHEVLRDIHYIPPAKTYGKVIEDRKTQVTFSALGQEVVARLGRRGVELKEEWKRKNAPVKMKIAREMRKRLPNLAVGAAGFTSIDVTRKGIDKGYGMRQIEKHVKVPLRDMVFVGDALYPGGNDYAVRRTGVDWIAVKGPEEAAKVIRRLIHHL
jgi:HAD superfamily hydrolase (TIGR01484 family)